MRPQIVLFGDNNTEQAFTIVGWGRGLAETYSRKADVIVHGYSDYNTRWALFMLDRIFPLGSSTPPVATIVFFGANDAAISGRSSGRLHVPVEEYKQNLRKIVSHLKKCFPKMLVVLVTPPPVNEEARRNYAGVGGLQQDIHGLSSLELELPDRTNLSTACYAEQCTDLAKELGLPCVDLFNKMQYMKKWWKEYLCTKTSQLCSSSDIAHIWSEDGLHLACEGNHSVRKVVSAALREHGLNPRLMPRYFPLAADIDYTDPEKSFLQ